MKKFVESGINDKLYTIIINGTLWPVDEKTFFGHLDYCISFNSDLEILNKTPMFFKSAESFTNNKVYDNNEKTTFKVINDEEINQDLNEFLYIAEIKTNSDVKVERNNNYLSIIINNFYHRILEVNKELNNLNWHYNNGILEVKLKKQ